MPNEEVLSIDHPRKDFLSVIQKHARKNSTPIEISRVGLRAVPALSALHGDSQTKSVELKARQVTGSLKPPLTAGEN